MISDTELVKRAKDGEKDAFGELIRRHEKPLFFFLYKKMKNRDTALDLLQETFIDAFVALSSLRDPDRFPGWVFTIARRKVWLARRRSIDWREISEPIATACSASDEALRKELVEIVRDAVRALPQKMRGVFEMHYLDEIPYLEISKRLGIPVSTVRSRLHLGRKQLRDDLSPFADNMPQAKFALRGRESSMELRKPEIRIEEVAGVKMDVELVEYPARFLKLEKGVEGGCIWFRNWADGKNDHIYLVLKSRVVGRASVQGEKCWEVEEKVKTPQGKVRTTLFNFCDRRDGGYYMFAHISRGKRTMPELRFLSDPVSVRFPVHLSLGMESRAFDREMKVERVVDVQINKEVIRALEVVYPAASFDAEGGKVLRLNRVYISEDGRNVLFQRYHSIEERASGVLPDDVPEIEHEGVKYLLYHYSLRTDLLTD